ncbi:MAG: uroporphyrinogen-III C-methyltransferase [bacterium]|nr:uroporphyrinogen-III C-methyltransferase [bacterium]
MSNGIVYLVGAGPGDPGLITVKGKRLLHDCDAVVYDRLSPLELVVTLPQHVERYYVGKSAECHSVPQEKINALLVQLAQRGLKVVRLKGGDPFVFGRGGEEALFLKKHNVPFEIVPGITAGIAVPAYAGIPITHRNSSVFAVLVTAHEASDKTEFQAPWEWLSGVEHGSIIGYMGVKQLSATIEKLIAGGMAPATPAALIQQGSTGLQRCATGRLADLVKIAEEQKISPPALFVIGDVVKLAKELAWFGKGPLAGKSVWVTRPADQAVEMYEMLREDGAEVLPLPTIAISEFQDSSGWVSLRQSLDTQKTRWLVFTSENGVRYFHKQIIANGYDERFWGGFKIAAVGSGTARELNQCNLTADFVPTKATTAVLADELAPILQDQSSLVVRVRGNLGDDRVERTLAESGSIVLALQVYSTSTAEWDAGMWAYLEENRPDVITFTSGSTVSAFIEILGKERALKIAGQAKIASIGPMTSTIAAEVGLQVSIEAKEYSVPGLIDEIVKYFR